MGVDAPNFPVVDSNILKKGIFYQLSDTRGLPLFNKVPLRTRRALSVYKMYGDSVLLFLNGRLLKSVNSLLVLSR